MKKWKAITTGQTQTKENRTHDNLRSIYIFLKANFVAVEDINMYSW